MLGAKPHRQKYSTQLKDSRPAPLQAESQNWTVIWEIIRGSHPLKLLKPVHAGDALHGTLSPECSVYSREEDGCKKDSVSRLKDAPGSHSDLFPTKLSYQLTGFLGIALLPQAPLGSWAQLGISVSAFSAFPGLAASRH